MHPRKILTAGVAAVSLFLLPACGADDSSGSTGAATTSEAADARAEVRYPLTAQGASDYVDDLVALSLKEFRAIEEVPEQPTLAAAGEAFPETVAFVTTDDVGTDQAQAFALNLWMIFTLMDAFGDADLEDAIGAGTAEDWTVDGDVATTVETDDGGSPVTELVHVGDTWSITKAVEEFSDEDLEAMRDGTYTWE